MMQAIIEASVRRRWVIFLLTTLGCLWGWWSLTTMKLDALPALGETQVILHSTWARSADLMESQVTYPIVTGMLGAPHVKTVRGFSDFGSSYVYVIFDESTDMSWARTKTLEYLADVRSRLPAEVKTEMGPDATSLGWVFQYVLTDTTGKHSLADLRSLQDWYVSNQLRSVRGVAEIAPIGGFTREFQVNLNPSLLQRYGISVQQVIDAVRGGNSDTSGRFVEFGGTQYIVRGRGSARSLEDFRQIGVAMQQSGNPILIQDLGEVVFGPALRPGIADLDGDGDVVSGIVIMRNEENALEVIDGVKARLKEVQRELPDGVRITAVYDRSILIQQTIHDVERTIAGVVITVVLVILIFLWHPSSALIPLVTLPAALLLAFIPLHAMGVTLNVMSLAGIGLACGELIDASIVLVEQTHKRLENWVLMGSPGEQSAVILAAIRDVAGPTFFTLLVIALSLLPILALDAQEGQMFRPLAYAKSIAVLCAALLAITLDPALRMALMMRRRNTFHAGWLSRTVNKLTALPARREEQHPISGPLMRGYEPVVRWSLRHQWLVLSGAGVLLLVTLPICFALGSEYMPPMDEGTILYMPTTSPGISISEAQRVLQTMDGVLRQFPEVDHVLGKAGRAGTATDPAPLSMFETLITLKPKSEWRHIPTWYTPWSPEWLKRMLRHITPDTISSDEVVREMNAALTVPGVSNAWTMPIKGRLEMLSSGLRTPLGLKISANDTETIERLGREVQAVLERVPGTRSVLSEPVNTGSYLDVVWRRQELARYGISIEQAQRVVDGAIGGDDVSSVVAGPERYPVSVRYMRDFRDTPEALGQIPVSAGGARQIPLHQLADIGIKRGPSMIRDENGMITGYVYVDLADRDMGSYIADADRALHTSLSLPPGGTLAWSGQYEAMQRVNRRLGIVIPATIALVMFLIYCSTRSWIKTGIVLLAVPFSAIGAVWLLYLLHFNLSIAVWVGLIGLLSIDAETGVFMLLYLDLAEREAHRRGRLNNLEDLDEAIVDGAAKRLRPKFMTFMTTCVGLLPLMWSLGAGSDVVKRIAAPMMGGIFTSFLLELLVYPVVYKLWKGQALKKSEVRKLEDSFSREEELALSLNGD